MPLITIITVVYNSEKFIDKTIKSVINQSYNNIEYIVIDGGSTDNTMSIINSYKNSITLLISEKDNGIYDAMNKGIINSNGEWLLFLNSGDEFHNHSVIENVFNSIISNDCDIIYGNIAYKSNHKNSITPSKISKNFLFNSTICHQSIFFNIRAFDLNGLYNIKYKILADREWLIRALNLKLNFHYVDQLICLWDEDGFSLQNVNLYIQEELKYREIYYNKTSIFLLKLRYKIFNFFQF